ncbi:glycosyltransferase family 4 protein [candidate division KSB1 bacterium]|nr:glycosyltransferase family 4 protein [candidate division KSB1 bacterium]
MKILFYCSKFPPQAGGAGIDAFHLGHDLSAENHKIYVICEHLPGLKKLEKLNQNYEINRVSVPLLKNRGSGLYFIVLCLMIAFKGIQVVLKEKIELVHCHDTATGIAGLITKFLLRKPTVFKFGGSMTYEYLCNANKNGWDPTIGEVGAWKQAKGLAKFILKIEQQYFKKFDRIYPIAEYLVDLLIQHLKIEQRKIRLIHNGVKLEQLKRDDYPDVKPQLKIDKMIFAGVRHVKYKGLKYLIQACQPILDKYQTHLVIAGDGPEEKNLKILAQNNPRIIFTGNLSWEENMRYVRSAAVYVLPTLVDKTPSSLMEALALKAPCITSDIPGVKELIGPEGGILVPPADASALQEKIIWLLEDPQKAQEMGQKGHEYIYKNFRWELTREKIKSLYFELMEKN